MDDIVELERKAIQAELAYHLAGVEKVRAKLAFLDALGATPAVQMAAPDPATVDLERDFRPEWKNGPRLTEEGVAALFKMFDARMRIVDAAILFRISHRSSGLWHVRWREARDAVLATLSDTKGEPS